MGWMKGDGNGAGGMALPPARHWSLHSSALLVPAGAVSALDPGGETQLLVPVGKAIGVKLFAEGVLVVGLSENEGAVSPAKKGGMKAGDLILTMNDVTIGSTEHLAVASCGERRAGGSLRRAPRRSAREARRLSEKRAGRRVPPRRVDPRQHGGHRHGDLL